MEFFFLYGTFMQQMHVHKYCKSARHSRHSMLLAIGSCALVFYVTHTIIGTNITNHSLKKKKVPCLDLFGNKTTCKVRHIQYVIHSSEDQFLNQNVNTSDFLSKCGKQCVCNLKCKCSE
mgnify:FL=1